MSDNLKDQLKYFLIESEFNNILSCTPTEDVIHIIEIDELNRLKKEMAHYNRIINRFSKV